jgi:hypothetical protein
MIKFFRHIRQRLLSESKFSKYLIYAIGEIILVIIGILFALQINTWNTERLAIKESEEFSVRLLSEVRANIAATDKEILKEKTQISSTLAVLGMFNIERSLLRSRDLDSLIYILMGKNEIDLSLATLNEGLNTGKIPLIRSDSLRALLYGFPTSVQKVKDSEKVSNTDLNDFLSPFIYEHINFRAMDIAFSPYKDELGMTGFPEHNSLESLDFMKFENLIDNIYYNSNKQLEIYQELKLHLESLEKLLEQ